MFGIEFDVDPKSKHECQNCGEIVLGEELNPIEDFALRVAPGEECPSGECPHCGAVCHPVKTRKRGRKS